ncbi:unnamed protein product [[Actinomadura] parvosata subsp. kistnae]|nr:unnamed protein product [Actinomadura parvosata subsp. kistnae]
MKASRKRINRRLVSTGSRRGCRNAGRATHPPEARAGSRPALVARRPSYGTCSPTRWGSAWT